MGELRNTICRPPSNVQLVTQKAHRLAAPPPAARKNSPSSGPFFPKGWQRDHVRRAVSEAWQRERVQRLARICRCLERGQAAGKSLRRMVRFHAWRWRGRHYKCDPARAILFKASTILRIYRMWRNGGRKPAALALHYWRGNRKASIGQVVKLSKLCLAPEIRAFSAAYRKLEAPGATESAYRYATPARLRAALAALLAHRRRGQSLDRAARQLLGGLER
jgi:hypothetical protein